MHNQEVGELGEQQTCDYLRSENFSILTKNFRTQLGEIDIIAQKKNTIAFVEVKTRKSKYFSLHGLISPSKQQKIIRAAKQYMSSMKQSQNFVFRFDVALLHYEQKIGEYNLEYISNAFGVEHEPTY